VLPVALESDAFAASSNWSSETVETCELDELPNMPPPRPDVSDDIPQPPSAIAEMPIEMKASAEAGEARLPRHRPAPPRSGA
jgi:hypothetical protein